MVREEEQFLVLVSYMTEVQNFQSRLMQVFKSHGGVPKSEYVIPLSQEVVRQFKLKPDNRWTTKKEHLILCFGFETGWTLDPKSTGAAGERGVFQFIPSTARSAGYDFSRFGSSKPEDIRYQVQCGFEWMGRVNTRSWARGQWCGSYPHAEREIGE